MNHNENQALINPEQVRKLYKTKAGTLEVLKGVDFRVGEGEFVAIVGPSGSGKSTLINMITGIDRPTEGEVHVANFFQLLPTLTVLENVMMPMNYTGTYTGKRKQRGMELLERVDLPDVAQKYPSQISGGQQQRAAIARALANNPRLIVGDEPTGNLDSLSAGLVFALFEELVSQGTTIVMVTHDRDLAGQVPHVVEVRDGRILREVDSRLVASSQAPFSGYNRRDRHEDH
ncbi:MAG: ABC transporter ATP-binding protein [Anaerolineae bacterium]|nr:MAG: ABC transporter ATP-binding protein [Anaerolineae bacterium]